jgi:proline utilization trans-activator
MGLHLNVPESHLSDRVTREHRNRVWWTAYEFERVVATRLSQPVGVQDDDFQVDLPSNTGLPLASQHDFADADHLVERIKLAKLSNQITKRLYGRRVQDKPFLQRVQQALKDLQDWVQSLAIDLRATKQRSLLLSFNQVRSQHSRVCHPTLMTIVHDRGNSSCSVIRPSCP